MNKTKAQNVLLDANVLYPAPLRDFLLNLAFVKCFIPKWTDEIQLEWISNLLKNRTDLKKSQLDRTVKLMNETFPSANITKYSYLEKDLKLPDENDKHVLAAAIKSKSSLIVTYNIKDFPKITLTKFGLGRCTPDDFVKELIRMDSGLVLQAFRNQLESLKNPPKTSSELLMTLEKNKLGTSTKLIRTMIE